MARELVNGAPGRKHGAYIDPVTSVCGGRDCQGGKDVERDGEGCHTGCCSDYRCNLCGDTFRIEWPD